jgi:hypothetical protein
VVHLEVVETQTDTLSQFIHGIGEIDFVGYHKLLLSAAENYDAKNGSTRHSQNRRANTHLFHDSDYDDNFKPYNIDMDVDNILINATRTQVSCIPRECWNQISINGHAIWRQIPNEDHTIILDGCPDNTVSGLMDLMSPSSRGCSWDTFSHTHDRTSMRKVHFGKQADDQTAVTETMSGMTQLDLIDSTNDQLGANFDTLQVQVAARKKDQATSQGKHPHFHPSKLLSPQATIQRHPSR